MSYLTFSRAEIQALFDRQIAGIVKKIDNQLKWMHDFRGSDQVVSLIARSNLFCCRR